MPNYRTNEDRRILYSPRGVNVVHDTTIGAEDSGALEVVTLAEFKVFLRLEGFTPVGGAESAFTYDDSLLTEIISAAREDVEQASGMLLSARSVTAYVTNECGNLKLPWGPVSGTVTGTDEDEVALTELKVFGDQFPSLLTTGTRIVLSYTGGYGTGEVPLALKQAVMRQGGYLYLHRGDEMEDKGICESAKKLIAKLNPRSWLV